MANVPCTLLLKSTNTSMVTPEAVYVAAKQMFKFGVKIIEQRGSEVMVKLSYTPKADTMQKKLGNLPIVYLRLAVEDDKELQTLKNLYQQYTFNLKDDEGETLQMLKDGNKEDRLMISDGRETDKIVMHQPQTSTTGEKRKTNQVNSDGNKKKKLKILEDRMIKPGSSTQPQFVEVYDDDAFDFDSQKYTFQEL